jgi:hypothetical protein
MSDWNNSVDWCLQKDRLVELIESLQTADCHIVLASNESSLVTEELGSEFRDKICKSEYFGKCYICSIICKTKLTGCLEFIEQVNHIPCKHQKERLYLLHEFTKDMRLCADVKMEDIVRRLNGHVVRALKCVCQRAASLAILKGKSCVENVCFDKAIQYVSFYSIL